MEVIIGLSTNNSTWVQAEQSGLIFRFFFFFQVLCQLELFEVTFSNILY